MKRALLALLLVTAACGSTNNTVGSGQFSAPSGLAVVPAADRDLLFVAGTGRDGLRALEICEFVDNDGNLQPSCPEDLQFVPGPIRVFPANIETDNRPVKLAGAWLTSDAGTAALDGGTRQGVVLAVGADKTVRIVDAKGVLDAVSTGQLAAPLQLALDGIPTDVVAENLVNPGTTGIDDSDDADTLTTSPSVEAFVTTVANASAPAELTEFTVTLDANGAAALPTNRKACALTNVVPSRIALAPRETPPARVATSLCPLDAGVATDPLCFPDTPVPTDDIFVGDAKGDGVVRVKRSSLQAAAPNTVPVPCVMTRISTVAPLPDGGVSDGGSHSVRALALSPQWYETVPIPTSFNSDGGVNTDTNLEAVTINHPAGELLMMVLEPDPTPTPGLPQDPGGVLFADLCTYSAPVAPGDHPHCIDFDGGVILPIPPYRYDQLSPGAAVPLDVGTSDAGIPLFPQQAMEPIAPGGVAREGAFLRAFRPRVALGQADPGCTDGACTAVFVGQGNSAVVNIFLLAAVTSTDGATYLIDVVHRRFINGNFYNLANNANQSLDPQLLNAPTLSPASAAANPPNFVPIPFNEAADIRLFGYHPGVTHSAIWTVIWHDIIPGLERVQGFATLSDHGTYFFDVPSGFADAQADPIIHFGKGDNVSFFSYSLPDNVSAQCKQELINEGALQLSFEASIVSVNPDGLHPDRLELFIDQAATGFNPGNVCTSFGAIAEFHTGAPQEWAVHQGDTAALVPGTILARIALGELYFARERRFDYPYDYLPTDVFPLPHLPPVASTDTGVAFSIQGGNPASPGSAWTFRLQSNLLPLLYSDSTSLAGLASGVVPYSSAANPNALFTAVTGSNSIVMATPSLLGGSSIGIRIFR